MEANANFIVPQEQINLKAVYENINGHCNGSKCNFMIIFKAKLYLL